MVGPVFPGFAVERGFEVGALRFTAPDGGVVDHHVCRGEEGEGKEKGSEANGELHFRGVCRD